MSFITTHIPDSVKITAKAPQKLNQLSTVVEKGNRKPVNQEIGANNGALLFFLCPGVHISDSWATCQQYLPPHPVKQYTGPIAGWVVE